MSTTPPQEVIDAIESGSSQITRRVEIYESDGETEWNPEGLEVQRPRLVEGSISINSSQDERRTLDGLVLTNDNGILRPNPYGGLWYDKILKPFRGIRYASDQRPPKAVIISSESPTRAYALRSVLSTIGFSRTDVMRQTVSYSEVAGYEIIISDGHLSAPGKSDILKQAYDAGKKIFTIGNEATSSEVPFITSIAATGTPTWGIKAVVADNPLAGSFTTESYPADAGTWITDVAATATSVARWNPAGDGTYYITAVIEENTIGGRWFHFHPGEWGTQAKSLWAAALRWLWNFEPYKNWEVQLGEFCIDQISDSNFPYQVKINGRDYTKRCLTSKLERTMSFEAGTPIRDLISYLANNAGCFKQKLPLTNDVLNSRLDLERGTERWSVMKQAAESLGYELFFDNQGYLTMRQYLDPSFSPISTTFKTGPEGNLTSYERSVNDSRLYNHICVYGDPGEGEEARLPYYGEAKNEQPSSPTRIDRIGDRLYTYASTFFTSDAQCQAYAETLLKLHALESYELSFGAINYPWMEAGELAEVLDPARLDIDPTRFLMDSINIPLGLGPMSITAKRVTFVGSSGN